MLNAAFPRQNAITMHTMVSERSKAGGFSRFVRSGSFLALCGITRRPPIPGIRDQIGIVSFVPAQKLEGVYALIRRLTQFESKRYFPSRSRVAICLISLATIWAASDGGWCEDSDIQVVCRIFGRTIGMAQSSPASISRV